MEFEWMGPIQVVLRRWWLVVIPVVIVALFSLPTLLMLGPTATGGFSTTIRYTAAQALEAIPDRDGDFQDVWLASELTVNAFSEWIRSSQFAGEVRAMLAAEGVEIDPGAINFMTDNDRSVGVIAITGPDAMDAMQLEQVALAAIRVLQTRAQVYFPQLGDQPARVTLLDQPIVTAIPPALPNRLRPLLQVAIALIAGIGLAFLVEYLDPILRRREQLEGLNLRVIAIIPREG